jgi:hypothetical protein
MEEDVTEEMSLAAPDESLPVAKQVRYALEGKVSMQELLIAMQGMVADNKTIARLWGVSPNYVAITLSKTRPFLPAKNMLALRREHAGSLYYEKTYAILAGIDEKKVKEMGQLEQAKTLSLLVRAMRDYKATVEPKVLDDEPEGEISEIVERHTITIKRKTAGPKDITGDVIEN